ncbi:ankyrin repeat containing protein [Fusarium sp. NRRL 52700]|nr:ankyrin repeat containing protein [Fusarium sp. NRRL 52700]
MEEAVVWLIESGADINENDLLQYIGRSPVQLAIELGYLTIAERLLRSGSKVNTAPSFVAGATALQSATIKGHIGLSKQLLDAGARVNARGSRRDGRTALEGAAEHGRLDMVELLLHHGALTTGPGRFQFIRAIRMAEREGYHAIAALLRQSRQWTDADTHTYDLMCVTLVMAATTPGDIAVTRSMHQRIAVSTVILKTRRVSYGLGLKWNEELEMDENVESEEGVELVNDSRWDASLEDILSRYNYL